MPQREQLTLAASGAIPVGAAVTVTLPDRYLLAGALLLYGLPLAALLAGAVAGAAVLGSDLAAAVGAALGLSAALLGSAPLRARLERATLRHLAVRWPA
jgi:positive regulator of sigma E activity